jgi:subtilisin family serine protease
MAQLGPMAQSVQGLQERLGVGPLLDQSVPLLPVGLRPDRVRDGALLDLLVTVPIVYDDPEYRDRTLRGLVERGFRPSTDTGVVVTGAANVSDLAVLANADEAVYIEAAGRVLPELNASVPEAWNGPATWTGAAPTGSGVLVGVIDTGVDVTHPSLRTSAGDTRVVRLWDHLEHPGMARPSSFDYGSEWDEADINFHLSMGGPFPSVDTDSHGTAVAGIIASNGLAAPHAYVGIAPAAGLVVVRLEHRPGLFTTSNYVIDALDYIFSVAKELSLPAVVNLSQGHQIGPHDAKGQFEQAITGLVSADPHRIVVTSAGNVGDKAMHARVALADGVAVDVEFEVPSYVGPFVVLDVWYDRRDRIAVELLSPVAGSSGFVLGSDCKGGQLGPDSYDIIGNPNVLGVRAGELEVKLMTGNPPGHVSAGIWRVRFTGISMTSGAAIDCWLDAGTPMSPNFISHTMTECTITAPATAKDVLTVGSYRMSNVRGQLSSTSSHGPDRLGNQLQLLGAPGTPITTCEANTSGHALGGGTSYAAAHVSGAIALMLEANKTLTRQQAIDCLLSTARPVGTSASHGFGAGMLDIHSALACANK